MTKQISQTKKQAILAKAPAHVKARILTTLASVRELLAMGYHKLAVQQLAYANSLIKQAASSVPQAIKWHKEVSSVSIVGTGKAKRYSAATLSAGVVTGRTAKEWLTKLAGKLEQAKIAETGL